MEGNCVPKSAIAVAGPRAPGSDKSVNVVLYAEDSSTGCDGI